LKQMFWYWQTDSWTDRQSGTDRQTDSRTDRDRQTDSQTFVHACNNYYKQMNMI